MNHREAIAILAKEVRELDHDMYAGAIGAQDALHKIRDRCDALIKQANDDETKMFREHVRQASQGVER